MSQPSILFLCCGGMQNTASQTWGFAAAKRAGWEVFVDATLEPEGMIHQLLPMIGVHPAIWKLHGEKTFDILTSGSVFPEVFPKYAATWKAKRTVLPRPRDMRFGNIGLDSLNILTDCGIEWSMPPPPFAEYIAPRTPRYLAVVCEHGVKRPTQKYDYWTDLLPKLLGPLMFLGNAYKTKHPWEGMELPGMLDLTGKTQMLPEILTAFRLCRGLIGFNVGLPFLAAACGVPTLVLAPMDVEPRGRSCYCCGVQSIRCSPSSSPEHVAQLARELAFL